MKISKLQVKEIKKLYKEGTLIKDLAKKFKVSAPTITYYVNEEYHDRHKKTMVANFQKKSLSERRAIYKTRLTYLREYQKRKYHEDESFRERKKKGRLRTKLKEKTK